MIITDKRFGGEIVASKGKIYKFDSLECMHNFSRAHKDTLGDTFTEYIADTTHDGELIPAKDAKIYEDPNLRSPMGKGYLTSISIDLLNKLIIPGKNIINQKILSWDELKTKLQQ